MPYQRVALGTRSRYVLVTKSRRVGFSEAMAARSAMRALGLDIVDGQIRKVGAGVPQNLISAGRVQAQDLMQRVLRYVRLFGQALGGQAVIRETATMAVIRGGVKLRALASTPRGARGWEGDVRLDEFANVIDQPAVWAAVEPLAKPTLGHPDGFEIWVVSTPLGDDNLFYEFARGRMSTRFEQHTVSIHDAAAQGFPILVSDGAGGLRNGTVDELRAEFLDDDIFAQEFECSFMSASSRFIDPAVYDDATWNPDQEALPTPDTLTPEVSFGGLDIGRHHDRTAFARVREHRGALYHLATDTLKGRPWEEQETWWDERIGACRRVAVDSTAIGSMPVERMQSVWGRARVIGVDFTLQSKERLATGLKLGLQTRRLRPAQWDAETRREVLSLRREQLPGGGVRYSAPRRGGGHGDRAWALALAADAAGASSTAAPSITTYGRGSRPKPVERMGLFDRRRLFA